MGFSLKKVTNHGWTALNPFRCAAFCGHRRAKNSLRRADEFYALQPAADPLDLHMALMLAGSNAHSRKPFKGVAPFYRALNGGAGSGN
jgi:hypothetical protein